MCGLPCDATLRRQRAFSLFVRAYAEVRRGVTYLRHHQDDVDDIMPSLYAGRTNRRKNESAPAAAAGTPAAPVPPAGPVMAPAPAVPAAAAGLPGSNPFSTT